MKKAFLLMACFVGFNVCSMNFNNRLESNSNFKDHEEDRHVLELEQYKQYKRKKSCYKKMNTAGRLGTVWCCATLASSTILPLPIAGLIGTGVTTVYHKIYKMNEDLKKITYWY